nr:hypothetical protein [Tanacetum cinerariifolium]
KNVLKGLVKNQVKEQVSRILPRVEESVNATLEAEVLTRSLHSSRTSYAVAADLSEMELKKILIEKMEGNKSIQRSDEQRNLYKALVEAYEADKAILDTYGDSTILKRRREDDDQEGPSAGPNRGSKRQKEGGEQASASTPSEKETKGAGGSSTGSQSRQQSVSKSAYAEEPVQTTCQMEETPLPMYETALPVAQGDAQSWISDLAKQADARSSFNKLLDTPIDFSNFIMHRLNVDTLTPNLLAGPTYELMRGSCSSLIELEYHLEEVYKATTDQLDWVNPEDTLTPDLLAGPTYELMRGSCSSLTELEYQLEEVYKATTDQLDWVNLEGQQYPHNLLQPLPLIPDNRGRWVIPFEHFIKNDLEYLRGDASSRALSSRGAWKTFIWELKATRRSST